MQRSRVQYGLRFILATWLLTSCAGFALTPAPRTTIDAAIAVMPTSSIPASTSESRLPPSSGALPPEASTPSLPAPDVTLEPTNVTTSTPTEIAPTEIVPTATTSPEPTVTPTIALPEATLTPTLTPTPIALVPIKAINSLFRPFPNGYLFANYGGLTPTDFTITDTRRMFGDDEVCLVNATGCVPRQEYLEFVDYVNQYMQYGHCDGITATTLRFFLNRDLTSSFIRNTRTASSLGLNAMRRQIAYYWALQVPDPVATAQYQSTLKTPVEILQLVVSAMSSPTRDMTSILVYNANRTAGHSMTPYAVENRGNGIWWIRVYDSNYPRNTSRYITVSTRTNTWSYNHGGRVGVWSGTAESHTLGAVPLSVYDQTPTCHLCWKSVDAGQASNLLVSSDVNSQLLVTNAAGERLGVIDGSSYDEIPNAFRSLLPGGLGQRDPAIFHLPITNTYVLSLSVPLSSTLEPDLAHAASIDEFGPGFAAAVTDITLTRTQSSQLTVRSDGRQLAYRSGPLDRDTFKMIVETDEESRQFVVGNTAVGAGRVLTLTIDDQRGQFVINNSQNISGTYDLSFTRVISTGPQTFVSPGIVITSTDTHSINYGDWPGTGPITMTIDVGSTGTVTRTQLLNDTRIKIYVPAVLSP